LSKFKEDLLELGSKPSEKILKDQKIKFIKFFIRITEKNVKMTKTMQKLLKFNENSHKINVLQPKVLSGIFHKNPKTHNN